MDTFVQKLAYTSKFYKNFGDVFGDLNHGKMMGDFISKLEFYNPFFFAFKKCQVTIENSTK